jgi:hypothetical protein
MLPLEYYEKSLQFFPPGQITICSETPNHPIVQHFVQKYNAKFFDGDEKQVITFLSSHNNLVLSQGSFSFWCGFFCDGQNIVNAIPKTGWNSNPNKNLVLLGNNSRYIKF